MYRLPLEHRVSTHTDLEPDKDRILKDLYTTGSAMVPTDDKQLLYLVKNAIYNTDYRWRPIQRGAFLRIQGERTVSVDNVPQLIESLLEDYQP
jgi:hypothetical protein